MFKVGDKVVFVDAINANKWSKLQMEASNVLIVAEIKEGHLNVKGEEQLLYFKEHEYGFFGRRFKLVEEAKPAPVKKERPLPALAAGVLVRLNDNRGEEYWMGDMNVDIGRVFVVHKYELYNEYIGMAVWFGAEAAKYNWFYMPEWLTIIPDTYDGYYAEAMRLKIPGRGRMNKEALKAAITAFKQPQAPQVAPPVIKAPVEAPKPLPEPVPLEVAFREEVGLDATGLMQGELCCSAIEFGNGRRDTYIMHWCHAFMSFYEGPIHTGISKIVEDVANLHHNHKDKEAYAEYVDWFVNESLFAPAFLNKDWREKSMVLNLDMAHDRIVSTQVALRQAYEYQGKATSWKWFADKGYDKHICFILSNLYQLTDGKWDKAIIGGGHSIFCSEHSTKNIIRFIREPWYNEESGVILKTLKNTKNYLIFNSFAPSTFVGGICNTRDKFFVTKKEGEGWGAKVVVDETKLIECAEYLKGLYNAVQQ